MKLSKKDVELLQVIQGVLLNEIESSEKLRDDMKDFVPQISDMCQGSVEDYQNAHALMQKLIDISKEAS